MHVSIQNVRQRALQCDNTQVHTVFVQMYKPTNFVVMYSMGIIVGQFKSVLRVVRCIEYIAQPFTVHEKIYR